MAKRKRLLPFGASAGDAEAVGADVQAEAEPRALLSPVAAPASGHTRSAPIADMAGAAAATAAMEEMADTLRQARENGRMVLALPLGQVEAGYLVRDRIAVDREDMDALVESLRARGQQTPVEVAATGPDSYGLISGWRRLKALGQLYRETGEARFGVVLALLRRPEVASEAYVAMVEENEIRVGLSFYERARIVAKAVEAGVYETDKAALRGLFASASRPKRSKIGSFLTVVRGLDGALQFPEAIGERLGLRMATALEADASVAPRLLAGLADAAAGDAAAEQSLILRLIAAPVTAAPVTAPAPPVRPDLPPDMEPCAGVRLRAVSATKLVIEGPHVSPDLMEALAGWLSTRG